MELQSHCSGPGRAESASLNVSVNAVRGGEKKGNDPPTPPSSTKQVEGVLITLALRFSRWLKMIRVPELMLILRDRLAITRV